jgi:hypothetical protein
VGRTIAIGKNQYRQYEDGTSLVKKVIKHGHHVPRHQRQPGGTDSFHFYPDCEELTRAGFGNRKKDMHTVNDRSLGFFYYFSYATARGHWGISL